MYLRRAIFRHALVSLSFVLLYLLLNRPEVIFFSRIGFVAWYPAIGLAMALMLGISPWYALLVCFADALAARILYAQPVMSFSNTVDAAGFALATVQQHTFCGVPYISIFGCVADEMCPLRLVSATAARVATIIGVACLIADHSITLSEYNLSAVGWFSG